MIAAVLWWAIPLGVTVASILAVFFWPMDDDFSADFRRLGLLVLALIISLLAWAIGAFCK